MSTVGQAVGGVVGAVAGFFVGGPTGALYGAQLGMMVGGYLDPAEGPHITGPRLDDLKVQTSTYGAPLQRSYGTVATAGNVFWLENNTLKEVVTEVETESDNGKGGGGSSTTTTTFSYFATFALGLCDCSDGHPVSGIRRIWCAGNLIYDAGSADLGTILASNKISGLFTLHNGALDQQPDARMQSALGVENTPAYRGMAYLVFNDFPLEKYGNSLMAAQFKVEFCAYAPHSSSVMHSGPRQAVSGGNMVGSKNHTIYGNGNFIFTFGHLDPGVLNTVCAVGIAKGVMSLRMYTDNFGTTSTETISFNCEYLHNDLSASSHISSDDRTLSMTLYAKRKLVVFEFDKRNYWECEPTLVLNPVVRSQAKHGRNMYVCVSNNTGGGTGIYHIDLDSHVAIKLVDGGVQDCLLYADSDGWVCYVGNTINTYAHGSSIVLSTYAVTATSQGATGLARLMDGIIIQSGVSLVFVPFATGSPVVIGQASGSGYSSSRSYGYYSRGVWVSPCISDEYYAYQSVEYSSITRITQETTTLGDVVARECLLSRALTVFDIDATALTTPIYGYKVSEVAAIRGAIEPLQAAYPFDVIQSGYKIVFRPRGGASVATIPASDLDARGAGDSPGVSITNVREMDSVLPRRVVVNYLDLDREYDTGTQSDERLNTDSVNVKTLDLAVVLNATNSLGIVQTLLYLYWMERYSLSFSLPPIYSYLEPGDVVTVNADEATYSLRLTGITYTQDNRLECTAKHNSAAIYTHTAQGESGQSTGQTLKLAGATMVELLDIPLVLDTLDQPGFPVAMAGYLNGWPGGVLLRSDDQGQTWASLQGFGKPGAKIGSATNAISAPANTAMIDKSSVLNVSMLNGELSSVSELLMLNGSNFFAYGAHGRWEGIAAQNCILQPDGSYNLTDLLRGQQGTEWACDLHQPGDRIIAIDSSLNFIGVNLNSIGLARTYRAVTKGDTLDSASDVPFTYTGVNLECLSPVSLNGSRLANDWTISWIRRTRVGGAWRDYVDASLGEASELYEVDIFSDGTYATVKRTITGLTSASATYTSAQQVTDFGSNQTTLYVKVYQISANVGRGYPLQVSITR